MQGKERKLEVVDKENWHLQSELERLGLRVSEVRAELDDVRKPTNSCRKLWESAEAREI